MREGKPGSALSLSRSKKKEGISRGEKVKGRVRKMARVQELAHTEKVTRMSCSALEQAEAKAKGQADTREQSGLLTVWSWSFFVPSR